MKKKKEKKTEKEKKNRANREELRKKPLPPCVCSCFARAISERKFVAINSSTVRDEPIYQEISNSSGREKCACSLAASYKFLLSDRHST
jgi:hypothetical protein